jgi:hypothetical protein
MDSVLAPLGSGTWNFAVYNDSRQNILVQEIALSKGDTSPFVVNINGQSQHASNMRIASGDHILIFVEVRSTARGHVRDSLVVRSGSGMQRILLRAYVEDCISFGDTTFSQDVHFGRHEPYLFFGDAIVGESAAALVDGGSRLLFARGKSLIIKGSIQINGSKAQPALLAGLRYRNAWYANKNGQWQGVVVVAVGAASSASHAIVRNANIAFLVADSAAAAQQVQLTLSKCAITFANSHLCVHGGRVVVDSSAFSGKLISVNIALPADIAECR